MIQNEGEGYGNKESSKVLMEVFYEGDNCGRGLGGESDKGCTACLGGLASLWWGHCQAS